MKLGLKRGTVALLPYDRAWAKEAAMEKERLMSVCGEYVEAIEHIGSTAIPGLCAKPIIDMSIGLKRFRDAPLLITPLNSIGYHFYKHFQHQMLFCRGPNEKRTHYLHIMRYQGKKWKHDLAFRAYLRSHPSDRSRYAKLKHTLAKRYHSDRQSYSDGKHDFITSIITKANHDFSR